MGIGDMKFRNNQGENRRNRLKDKCKGKNGQIDNAKDHPPITFNFLTSFQGASHFRLEEKTSMQIHNIIQFKIKCIHDGCMFAAISIIQLKISMGREERRHFNFILTEQNAVSRLRGASPHLLCSFVRTYTYKSLNLFMKTYCGLRFESGDGL